MYALFVLSYFECLLCVSISHSIATPITTWCFLEEKGTGLPTILLSSILSVFFIPARSLLDILAL
ncbi:hypothetical protein EDB83DRAFT_2445731 [Lactarius deliciosus]|nr:hypothetical protein EDB83DRAFT_2445731 [Lactarius deliciosus]